VSWLVSETTIIAGIQHNFPQEQCSTPVSPWCAKLPIGLELGSAVTPFLIPCNYFCLLRWRRHFRDAGLNLQMSSTRLSQHHYTICAQMITTMWMNICLTDDNKASTFVVITLSSRGKMQVCCGTSFQLIPCVWRMYWSHTTNFWLCPS